MSAGSDHRSVLRVVAACGSRPAGGAENYFLRFVLAAQNPAYRLEVIPFVRRASWLAGELDRLGLAYHAFGFGGRLDLFTTPRLRRALKAIRPHATISFLSRAAHFMPKVAGTINISRQGGFYNQKYFTRMDHVVSLAPAITEHIARGGFPLEDVSHITNMAKPVPADFRKRPDLRPRHGLPEDAFIWLAASRLHRNKNLDTALEVFARLDARQHLFIVGTGPEEAALKAQAERLGLGDRVTFHGWVSDISEVAALADGWFFPSRVEPLGSNTVDAWAHDLPLVAANVSGPASLITDGQDALLVAPDDVAGMAETLTRVAEDGALRQRLVAGGRSTLARRHSEPQVMRAWYDLVARLSTATGELSA